MSLQTRAVVACRAALRWCRFDTFGTKSTLDSSVGRRHVNMWLHFQQPTSLQCAHQSLYSPRWWSSDPSSPRLKSDVCRTTSWFMVIYLWFSDWLLSCLVSCTCQHRKHLRSAVVHLQTDQSHRSHDRRSQWRWRVEKQSTSQSFVGGIKNEESSSFIDFQICLCWSDRMMRLRPQCVSDKIPPAHLQSAGVMWRLRSPAAPCLFPPVYSRLIDSPSSG